MNAQTIRVLYIGEEQAKLLNAISSVIPQDNLMIGSNTKTALAMYALYMPDVIVIDGDSAVAQAAMPHLGVFGTRDTLDLMLLIGDDVVKSLPEHAVLHQLPTTSTRNDILCALERLITEHDPFGLVFKLPHSA